MDGVDYSTDYGYDAVGRTASVIYPGVEGSRLTVGYHYTDSGFLQYVTDASAGSVLWAATATNALGQVTNEYTGNGVSTTNVRNSTTGWMLSSSSIAQADSGRLIESWAYDYDEAGDLLHRYRSDEVGTAQLGF